MHTPPVSTVKKTAARAILILAVAMALASAASAQSLFVSYERSHVIEKFDLATGADLGVFVTTGSYGPEGLAFDKAGNLYAAISSNNNIMKFTPGGVGSTFASARGCHPHLAARNGLPLLKANLTKRKFIGNALAPANRFTTSVT